MVSVLRFIVFNGGVAGLLIVANGYSWKAGLCVVAANVLGFIEGRAR